MIFKCLLFKDYNSSSVYEVLYVKLNATTDSSSSQPPFVNLACFTGYSPAGLAKRFLKLYFCPKCYSESPVNHNTATLFAAAELVMAVSSSEILDVC